MSLNKVMLIGNVGKDPEVRYLETPGQNGMNPKVATITLATSERYRDRNGEVHENTEWHNIVAWRGLADTAEKYIKKGTQIYVEGRLRTRSWTDASGAKKYTTEVVADNIQLLGKRPDATGAPTAPSAQTYAPAGQAAAPAYPQSGAAASPVSQAPVEPTYTPAGPDNDLPF